MDQKGYAIFPGAIEPAFVQELAAALEQVYPAYQEVHREMGYLGDTQGGAHHILIHKGCFLEFLRNMPTLEYVRAFLGGNPIVNSYGGFNNARDSNLYVKRIHRDIRFFDPERRHMLNMLVMLDDFTLENGATFLLAGSHLMEFCPDETHFSANAERGRGDAGSILLFDSRLWHATGDNLTDKSRRALTLTFTRPHFKPQFDYCRALGYDFCETLSQEVKQLIGFHARVPASLREWYQPPQQRFYK